MTVRCAECWVRWMVQHCGGGFHPDSMAVDYNVAPSHEYDAELYQAIAALGYDELCRVALDETTRL
jgi:hypothetical protein